VPLSAVAVWFGILILGVVLAELLDRLCPADLIESGFCTASWHKPAFDTLLGLCTALVSTAVVLVPARIAPAHKFAVAAAAYISGAAFAFYILIGDFEWWIFMTAALSGSVALAIAAVKWLPAARRLPAGV
jgi:hypothetical protein